MGGRLEPNFLYIPTARGAPTGRSGQFSALFLSIGAGRASPRPVSYTHLDVYKRQMLCGVCGGLAEYFDLDPTLVRVGWVIAFFAFSVGLWAYLICAIIMPKKSDVYPGY